MANDLTPEQRDRGIAALRRYRERVAAQRQDHLTPHDRAAFERDMDNLHAAAVLGERDENGQ